MAVISNSCLPNEFEQHKSLKSDLTNIRGLYSNFVDYEFFFKSDSLDILALCDNAGILK